MNKGVIKNIKRTQKGWIIEVETPEKKTYPLFCGNGKIVKIAEKNIGKSIRYTFEKRKSEKHGVYYVLREVLEKNNTNEKNNKYKKIAVENFSYTLGLIEKNMEKMKKIGIDPTEVFRIVYATMTIQEGKEYEWGGKNE